MKKNNKWLTLTLSLTFLLLAGACIGVANSFSSINSISINTSRIEESSISEIISSENNINCNLVDDANLYLTLNPLDTTDVGINLKDLNLSCDYQYFVFKVSNLVAALPNSSQGNYIIFEDSTTVNNYLSEMYSDGEEHYMSMDFVDLSSELNVGYITLKYDKSKALTYGYNNLNINSLSFHYQNSSELSSVDSLLESGAVDVFVYQNNDGIILDPTTLF